jgi:hypothetical protein
MLYVWIVYVYCYLLVEVTYLFNLDCVLLCFSVQLVQTANCADLLWQAVLNLMQLYLLVLCSINATVSLTFVLNKCDCTCLLFQPVSICSLALIQRNI